MLQLILGRTGTGKTQYMFDHIQKCMQEHPDMPLYCIVPEQVSFEYERNMIQKYGTSAAQHVQVLSFTRLGERVFREQGGLAGNRIDDVSRALLMSASAYTLTDHLTLYHRVGTDNRFIQSAVTMLSECKQNSVSPLLLQQTADKLPESTTKTKLTELSALFSAFESLVGHTYADPLDDLSYVAERIRSSHLFDDATIFLDCFKGFTEQELRILESLMIKSTYLGVVLTTDDLQDNDQGFGLFSNVKRTGNQLLQLAEKNNIKVLRHIRLTEQRRFRHDSLSVLEAGCFSQPADPYTAECDHVTVIPCEDVYAESALVAREIRRLIRTENIRLRDIAITCRDWNQYRGVLDTALNRCHITYFMDDKDSILTDPLINTVLSVLNIVTGRWQTEDILRLCKTGLLGFSSHSIALIENYVYAWNITGAKWKANWEENPDGLTVKLNDITSKKLVYINRLRNRLIKPLETLQKRLQTTAKLDGYAFADAVYHYLTDIKIARMVKFQASRLLAKGENELAVRMGDMWNILIDLLDKMATVYESISLSPRQLTDQLHLAASTVEYGHIPQSLDAVQVGCADRMRFTNPRIVFILGANEGGFPAYPSGNSLINDDERQRLADFGLTLSDTSDSQAVDERYFAYMALSAASERIYVSYLLGNSSGETLYPSVIVETVRYLLPNHRRMQAGLNLTEQAETERDVLQLYARSFQSDTADVSTLKTLCTSFLQQQHSLSAVESALHSASDIALRKTPSKLFGKEMVLSPSGVERFHHCRFAYFCQYGLRVKPRRKADLNAAEFGTVTHYVMEKLLPVYVREDIQTIKKQRVSRDTTAIVEQYAEEFMGGLDNKTSRFHYLLSLLITTCHHFMWHVVQELQQSCFVPTDYELSIFSGSDEPHVDPVVFTLPDDTRICVVGVIDRVDVYKQGDKSYVRIVDYKTGSKKFNLDEVVEGINLQMLLYLFTLWQNGFERYGQVSPAGILYRPANLPIIKADRYSDTDEIEKMQIKEMKMDGLLLNDPAIVQAMEAEAAGIFIPAKLNKKGEVDSRSSVASLAQFGVLKKRTEEIVKNMAESLQAGEIGAVPARGKVNACEYCDYRSVCGYEQGDAVHVIRKKDADTVWKELNCNAVLTEGASENPEQTGGDNDE